MTRWLTPQEVGILTGLSANQVLHAIEHGDIVASFSPYPHGKGRWWIAEEDVARYRETLTKNDQARADDSQYAAPLATASKNEAIP